VELTRDLDDGLPFDADRAYALLAAAGELCYLGPDRPVGGSCLELYATAARVEGLLAEPNTRAALGLALAHELRLERRAEEARVWLERSAAFGGALYMRPWILAELADLERTEGSIDLAEQLADEARSAADAAGLDEPDREDVERTLLELELTLALEKGLIDQFAILLSDYERMGAEHLDVLRFRVKYFLASDQYDRLIDVLKPELARLDPRSEAWAEFQYELALAEAERARLAGEAQDRAASLFEQLAGDPAHPEPRRKALIRLADCRIRMGDAEAARAPLEAVRADYPSLSPREGAWVAALEARTAVDTGQPAAVLAERMAALEEAYDALLASWEAVPLRPAGVGFLKMLSRRDVLTQVVGLRLEIGGPGAARHALGDLLRARAMGSLAQELAAGPEVTLAEIQAGLLGPRRGALVYLPGTDRSYVFAVDAERVSCHELPPLRDWNPARRRLALALRRPPGPDDAEASREEIERLAASLTRDLLPPEVRERLRSWNELYVEGMDLAGYLPFELLTLDRGDGVGPRPLGLSLPLAYLPSLNVGALLLRRAREDRPPGRVQVAVVAAPEHVPAGAEEIPWTAASAEPVGRAYGRDRVAVWSGSAARASVLSAPELGRALVLQLVLHGLYDPDRERPGGIAFEPEEDGTGEVWCEDVDRLSHLPPLVFLAICSAGRGPLRTGDDGVSHVGGSLLRAGARTVILSPIDLEFHATMELSDVFHDRLGRLGESPASAMAAARLALAEGRDYEHPFFHSAVHVVGLGHVPLFTPDPARAGPIEEERPRTAAAVLPAAVLGLSCVAALLFLRWRRARRVSS